MKSNINIKEIVCDHRFWMLVCYIIAIAILACFHEPWGDEIQAWYLAVVHNVPGLFERMAIEGHFMLWHMLLYPFAKMGMSCTVGLPLVSSILMAIAAWLLIYKSPFNTLTKLFLLLSYPILFFFPIVSRCYALIPPILFYLATVYPQRMQRPISYGIGIGLLFNTHMYMEGLTIIMMACWGIEIIKCVRKKQKDVTHDFKKLYIGYGIALALGLFAFSQVVGNFFLDESVAFNSSEGVGQLTDAYYHQWFSTISKPSLYFAEHGMMPVYALLKYGSIATMIAVFVWAMRDRKQPLLFFAVAFAYQLVFATLVYACGHQRSFLPIILMIFCLWIGRPRIRRSTIWAALVFVGSLYTLVYKVSYDISFPYSDYQELHKRLVELDKPNTYIKAYGTVFKIARHSFGSDTIANAQNYYSDPQLYQLLRQQRPQQFVLMADRTNGDKPEVRIEMWQMFDSIKAQGYVCTDSATDLKFLEGLYLLQQYSFELPNNESK